MQRIDGSYLYEVSHQLHPITTIPEQATVASIYFEIIMAEGALDTLLNRSVYRISTSAPVGNAFLKTLRDVQEALDTKKGEEQVPPYLIYQLRNAATKFETVFNAELSASDLYMVTKKRGYVTSELVWHGHLLFPDDLPFKVPQAISDIQQGTRCLAFELPTAAAFHLHRANETVLRAYFHALAPKEKVPGGGAMGDFIKRLEDLKLGDTKVLACLRDLKNLHRNPVVHPDQSLDTVDDAIALLGIIQTAIVYMLKEIPMPPPSAAAAPLTS